MIVSVIFKESGGPRLCGTAQFCSFLPKYLAGRTASLPFGVTGTRIGRFVLFLKATTEAFDAWDRDEYAFVWDAVLRDVGKTTYVEMRCRLRKLSKFRFRVETVAGERHYADYNRIGSASAKFTRNRSESRYVTG